MKNYLNCMCFILVLFLSGCNGSAGYNYYKKFSNNKVVKLDFKSVDWNINDKNYQEKADRKKYCVYSLSYFFPINFWDLRFNDKQYIKKAIKDINKAKYKGESMKNITIHGMAFGSPIFSFFCTDVSGIITDKAQ